MNSSDSSKKPGKKNVKQSDIKNIQDLLSDQVDSKNEDRVTIITSVAHIDDLIKDILTKILVPTIEDQDSLLDEGRSLGSFMLRARLAHRLGVISEVLYAGLKDLSKIRNKCAHSSDNFNPLKDQSIIQSIRNLYERLDNQFREKEAESLTPDLPGLEVKKLEISRTQFLYVTGYYRAVLKDVLNKREPLPLPTKEIIFR